MKSCEQFQLYISAFLDEELDDQLQQELFIHLAGCSSCRSHLRELQELKHGTNLLKEEITPPVDGEYFWRSLYNRLERGISWIMISLGSVVLFMAGLVAAIEGILKARDLSLLIKVSLIMVIAGSLILFISVLREKLFVRKFDKYLEVKE